MIRWFKGVVCLFLISGGILVAQEAVPETPALGQAPVADSPGVVDPPAAVTAPPAAPASTLNTGDQAWMLACSAFVLLMTPGLAFFYGGLVGRKNILSILMQCFMCMAVV
ncbi:MAG: ammonia channel protein, partial [Planctomycetota bacterium]